MFLTVKNKSLDITHLKSVIFDMDGTLIESEHVWAEAKKHIAEIYGQKVSDEELQKFIGRGISDFIDEVFGPTTVFKKEMIKTRDTRASFGQLSRQDSSNSQCH